MEPVSTAIAIGVGVIAMAEGARRFWRNRKRKQKLTNGLVTGPDAVRAYAELLREISFVAAFLVFGGFTLWFLSLFELFSN